MKNVKYLLSASLLVLISCSSYAQTVTTTAGTLDDAEAHIAAMAKS
ncbi:hypothetical protein [Erwinia sp. OLCASP19]